MRIALIVDNPFRDLAGTVLVAARLCRAGATCYLVPGDFQVREVSALAPDFVLLNCLRPTRQPFARRLLEAGIAVGVLDDEGGVHPSLEHYRQLSSPDVELFRQVACFCCWGPRIAEFGVREGWYRQSQVVVSGAPRFDLYAPPWRNTVLRMFQDTWDHSGPLVLVNGRFPTANPAFNSTDCTIQGWEALGFERDEMRRYQQVERQAMLEMAELTNRLATRFPDVSFVYRPHPFERPETYQDLLDARPNLHLVKHGTVEGWILRASAVIQRISTTALEARIAGTPSLSPTWIRVPQEIPSTDEVSVRCTSLEMLCERLEAIVAGRWTESPAESDAAARVIEDWFYRVDGAAHERVASAILECPIPSPTSSRLRVCEDMYYRSLDETDSVRQQIGSTLRRTLRLPVTWSFTSWKHSTEVTDRWDRSNKAFDSAGVETWAYAVTGGNGVVVSPAVEGRDYGVPFRTGRSIAMGAAS